MLAVCIISHGTHLELLAYFQKLLAVSTWFVERSTPFLSLGWVISGFKWENSCVSHNFWNSFSYTWDRKAISLHLAASFSHYEGSLSILDSLKTNEWFESNRTEPRPAKLHRTTIRPNQTETIVQTNSWYLVGLTVSKPFEALVSTHSSAQIPISLARPSKRAMLKGENQGGALYESTLFRGYWWCCRRWEFKWRTTKKWKPVLQRAENQTTPKEGDSTREALTNKRWVHINAVKSIKIPQCLERLTTSQRQQGCR